MYKVGMYGGSFNPLHQGHVNDIIVASNQCETLYVVLSVSDNPEEIDHRERYMWLKHITDDMKHVEVIEIFDHSLTKDEYDWKLGALDVKKKIGKPIDVVFAGDDYQGKHIWETLYPESEIIYLSRDIIPISSTQIRKNPYEYFEYLPNCVRPYYTKRICFIGTESCGKTTLVRNLAKYFNTTHVEEAGRYICDDAGGIDNMQPKHYFEILLKHKALEKEALKHANKVLLVDTDSLITLYYYQLGFEQTGEVTETFQTIAKGISELNQYDMYLFLEPDVAWVQDGTRTYGEEEVRKSNNDRLKQIYQNQNIVCHCISGNYEERFEKAKTLIKQIMR